ncbi:MAG: hypothetical protein GY875_04560 [Gammaproteobacteria bacterium]|nr:hypothetical protein [Gammaproteobacteria bacterium]
MQNIKTSITIAALVFYGVANTASHYRVEMPPDPGEHIKMRIQYAPVI